MIQPSNCPQISKRRAFVTTQQLLRRGSRCTAMVYG